jgi:hypothetical protein
MYDTDEQKQAIIEMINMHNNEPNFDLVGEPLYGVQQRTLKRRVTDGKYLILFGHGGGCSYTYDYFYNHGIPLRPYNRDMDIKMKPEAVSIKVDSGSD